MASLTETMFEDVAIASISLLASIVCLSFGIFVYLKNPHLRSSRVFIILASVAALATLTEAFIITSPGEVVAQGFARILVFLTVLLAATMLYMTSCLPYDRQRSLLVRRKKEYVLIVILIGAILALLNITVEVDQYGWWISSSLPTYGWYATIYLFYLSGAIILDRMHGKERREDVRYRIVVLTVGMALPIISAAVVVMIGTTDQNIPPVFSLTVLASSLCFAYGIMRQKLFIIGPVKEEVQAFEKVPGVRSGQGVLVETKGDDLAYRMFINEIASGSQGLLIARTHPDQIRERYGLKSTPILWLTTIPGSDSIDPKSISLLLHSAIEFLKKKNGSIIMMDGLEYLGVYNRPEAILQFIYTLRDTTTMTGSKLIVAVDPEALGKCDLPRLERELEPIKLDTSGVRRTTQSNTA